MSKTRGFFFVAQDMVLSHRAKFYLIINFFRVKAVFTELYIQCNIFFNITLYWNPINLFYFQFDCYNSSYKFFGFGFKVYADYF